MGKTIAIAGKGGVGKTTLSGLIIEVLRRRTGGPILAIDADPNATLAEVLGLEEGLRRITSLPASRIGLTDRGRLVPGAFADLTLFNLEKVKDNSSIANPNVYPDGFERVIVSGVTAFSHGKRSSDHTGKILRRN